ncbi:MAG: CHAT domain-containing protein, partial [Myxococcota bacterium]
MESLDDSDVGVLALSRVDPTARWMGVEVEALLVRNLEEGVRIIPVYLEPVHDVTLPSVLQRFARLQAFDEHGALIEAAMQPLVDAIHDRSARPPEARPRPRRARRGLGLHLRWSEGRLTSELWDLYGSRNQLGSHQAAVRASDLDWAAHALRPSVGALTKGETDASGSVARVGATVGAWLFGGRVGEALEGVLERDTVTLEVLADLTLHGLPVECAQLGARPLTLRPHVGLVRRGARDHVTAHIPGPLRILVAVAAPESDLDHEAELGVVLKAVDEIRAASVIVDFVDEDQPTLRGITSWAKLTRRAYHVLHLSAHGRAGELLLEGENGTPAPTRPEALAETLRALPVVPPLVVLSACHSARPDDLERAGFVDALLGVGVRAVLAMAHPVTDRYAIRLAGQFYTYLAAAEVPDPVWALAEARREVARLREAEARQGEPVGPPEYGTPVLFVNHRGLGPEGRKPLFDRAVPHDVIPARPQLMGVPGFNRRSIGDFVGRRGLRRRLRQAVHEGAGAVLQGQGGIGKSTLAASLADRLLRGTGDWAVVVVVSSLDVHTLARAVRVEGTRPFALPGLAADASEDDKERALRQVLAEERVLLILDNLESRQDGEGGPLPEEEARLLRTLAAAADRGAIVVTGRYPVPEVDDWLVPIEVGSLTDTEQRKLLWRLPALRKLPD